MVKNLFYSILFLGVIPCDAALFTLYLNESLGAEIVLFFNIIVCGITGIYFLKNIKNHVLYEKLIIKYLFYAALMIVLNMVASANANEPFATRIFSIVCLFSYYIFCLFVFKDINSLIISINITLLFLITVSLAVYLIKPEVATYQENAKEIYFKGVVKNRNSFGEISLFFITTNIFLWSRNKKYTWYFLITTAIGFVATYMTHSAASTVSAALIIFLSAIYFITKKLIPLNWFLIAYGFIFVSLIIIQSSDTPFLADILKIFNKSSTLTGRMNIWPVALKLILEHPLLGHGYDTTVLIRNGIILNDPHNSILYMLLTQGFVGTGIFFAFFFTILYRGKKLLKNNNLFALMYIFILAWMIRGLVESVFSYAHFVFWLSLLIIEMLTEQEKQYASNGEKENVKAI